MNKTIALSEFNTTWEEEVANFLSHAFTLVLAVAGVPVLITNAVRHGSASSVVGACIFSATMVLLYLTSTLYHALPPNRAKRIMQVIDHGAIFLLIAGTYTPFTLGVLYGTWGWTLFGLVWGLALFGVTLKALTGVKYQKLSNCLYLGMGWIILVAIKPFVTLLPGWGMFWIAMGGVFYTAGVYFFCAERMKYNHFIWHLFVTAGTVCHFFAILWYAG